jgi:hypothetical protein
VFGKVHQWFKRVIERRKGIPTAESRGMLEESEVGQSEAEKVRAMLDEIRHTRYPLSPGTPDSIEMLREDRAR